MKAKEKRPGESLEVESKFLLDPFFLTELQIKIATEPHKFTKVEIVQGWNDEDGFRYRKAVYTTTGEDGCKEVVTKYFRTKKTVTQELDAKLEKETEISETVFWKNFKKVYPVIIKDRYVCDMGTFLEDYPEVKDRYRQDVLSVKVEADFFTTSDLVIVELEYSSQLSEQEALNLQREFEGNLPREVFSRKIRVTNKELGRLFAKYTEDGPYDRDKKIEGAIGNSLVSVDA